MVHILGKPGFLAEKLFELLLGGPGTFFLKFRPEPPVAVADIVVLTGGVNCAVGVHGDVLDAKIYAENAGRISLRRGISLTGREKIKRAVPINEVGLSLTGKQQVTLTVSTNKE